MGLLFRTVSLIHIGSMAILIGQERFQKAGESEARQEIRITLENGKLAVNFQKQDPRSVAEQLTSVTRVTVVLAQEIEDGQDSAVMSADMKDVPLDEALRALFSNYDTFFFYGASNTGTVALRTVWVYPKGSAAALKPVRPEQWASSRELEAALRDNDPEVRALAYEALVGRPDRRNLVLDALSGRGERDPDVRGRVLSTALSKGFDVPADILQQLARADSSEHIRWLALDALAEQPSAKEVAEAAATDPSEMVRNRAKELLMEVSRRQVRTGPDPQDQPAELPQ